MKRFTSQQYARNAIVILAGTTLSMVLAITVQAQSNRADTRELISEGTQTSRDAPLQSASETPHLQLPDNIILPQVPDVKPHHRAVSMQVNTIQITGGTLLDPESLASTLARYEGRQLTLEEVQAAANAVTKLYISGGYLNSGVLIPDQDASDGIVKMTAVEGELTEILLVGNDHLRDSFIEKRLRAELGPNLNVYDVENALRLMQQNPMIEQVNAQILPGQNRGESLLDLRVTERDPMVLRAGYNNHRSPSVGEHQGQFSFTHSSLTGNGDYLLANYALTDGAGDISATYGIPLTAGNLTWESYYSQSDSDIVESAFKALDIVSELTTWGTRFYRPVYRTLNHSVNVSFGFETTHTESFLSDEPFSFSPGEQLGESDVSLLRLSSEWTWRREMDALYTRASINKGVDWLDATDNSGIQDPLGNTIEDLPDSDFTSVLLQSKYARALPWHGMQLLGRLTAQVASDPLLSSQKLALGGVRSVRGYRENQLVRDNGVIASVELRIPLWRDDNNQSRYGLTLAPFFDYGWAKDESIGLPGLDSPQSDELMSVGAGVIWNWWKPLYVEVYYGEQLEDANNTGDSLQEDGFHIQTYLQWTF